jgi:hypothetical protein
MQLKNPEDVMEELEILMAANFATGSIEGSKYSAGVNRKQIRSSLASVLCHMAEIPKPIDDDKVSPQAIAYKAGYEKAIDDCKAILINEAKKITDRSACEGEK